jgi:hypothetical protein
MQRAHQPGAPNEVYAYDALSQLTDVWTGTAAITSYDHNQTYTLDPLSNRRIAESGA